MSASHQEPECLSLAQSSGFCFQEWRKTIVESLALQPEEVLLYRIPRRSDSEPAVGELPLRVGVQEKVRELLAHYQMPFPVEVPASVEVERAFQLERAQERARDWETRGDFPSERARSDFQDDQD